MDEHDRRMDEAASLGREHGTAAGSWVVDGNTSTETLRAVIEASDEGTLFECIVREPVAPLSGEFADTWTPRTLAEALEIDEDDDGLDDYCSAFEDAYYQAFEDEAVRSARAMLPTTYRVHGIAHGTEFDERGFEDEDEATAYASSVIDGDVDSTVEVTPES